MILNLNNKDDLKFVVERGGEIIHQSANTQEVIKQIITILYDAQLKRCKCKIEQYYKGTNEYCRIIGKYKDSDGKYTFNYIVSGFCNEWGNFINVDRTLTENAITIE